MPPEQAVRGAIVLCGLTRRLERDAEAVRAEQAEVAALQAQLDAAAAGADRGAGRRRRRPPPISTRRSRRRDAARQEATDAAAEAAARAAADAARADSLRAALRPHRGRPPRRRRPRARGSRRAERQPPGGGRGGAQAREEALALPAGPGVGEARGQLASPVAGTLVRGFGAATEAGPATGVTYRHPARRARGLALRRARGVRRRRSAASACC